MSIDQQTVKKVAKLARIRMNEEDIVRYGEEMNGILDWIDQLQEVNTDDVPMLASVADVALPWRSDEVNDGNRQKQVLTNAPANEYGCFVVPKVVE